MSRIALPTLILCGDADRMTPVKYSKYLHDQIAGSQLIVVPGTGHMVMLEQPAAVAEAVADPLTSLAVVRERRQARSSRKSKRWLKKAWRRSWPIYLRDDIGGPTSIRCVGESKPVAVPCR